MRRRRLRNPGRSSAFTLVEVLATLMLVTIVLPTVMRGIFLATSTASSTVLRTEAASIAESKLSEIVAGGQWQNGNLTGDIQTDRTTYHWAVSVQVWPQDNTTQNLQQLDLQVTWPFRNQTDSLTLTTLAYARGQ